MTSFIQFPLHSFATFLAQTDTITITAPITRWARLGGPVMRFSILLMVASMWKVFTKAGEPGWASLIPIYNIIVWCKIVGRPAWWFLLLLIPCVNFVILIMLCIDLAKSFGKGAGFGIGLVLLGFIFFPILAFSSAQYAAPRHPQRPDRSRNRQSEIPLRASRRPG